MIVIEKLEKSFNGQRVLRELDLTIQSRESLVVIGRSGCGKSVLLKHVIGLMRPDSGHVYIDSDDVTAMSETELNVLRKRFGMVFQGAALFDSLTVGENIALPLREHTTLSEDEILDRVRGKLRLVGLEGIEAASPASLSGGMKKRVGLARAIAMDPEFVLYDEPTTGLDPIMADAINSLIRTLQKQLSITSVAVTHDMRSAYRIGDTIAMLHDGKIIYKGTPDEIRKCEDPIVCQFITGNASGPMSQSQETKNSMGNRRS
ncbi:MAG: ABC transporter ATP-binding protein [Candidatus Eisenbacteria bacterium]|nr:ABC transporter ATP-binding protein [Candidatus Eisenbacteria bacterium]